MPRTPIQHTFAPSHRRSSLQTRLTRVALASLAAWMAAPAFALYDPADAGTEPRTDRVIVKYRNAANSSTLDSNTLSKARNAGNRQGLSLNHQRARGDGNHVLRANRAMTLTEAQTLADAIRSGDGNVEYAEPDRIMRIQLLPNDTSYSSQWHYSESTAGLNLPAAWDKSTGSGVVVAVIDTGYRPHADLAANIVSGYDFIIDTAVSNDGNGRDGDAADPGDAVTANECGYAHTAQASSWHGTHVAGTIAALTNNGSGVAGVAFGAKVMPVRVLGKCGGYTSDIADAIIWASGGTVSGVAATSTPAKVLNLSLGGSGACDTTTQNAINTARSRGSVVVVAAGNSNTNVSNASPANCSGVIAVAAVNRSGGRAYYSNYGALVDVAAPGGDVRTAASNGILSTLNAGASAPGSDSYAWYQGTSMATPHVAGVVALMLAKNSALTPDEVETRLKASARAFPSTCTDCGAGLVDASAAVDAAAGTTTPTPTPVTTTVAEVETNNTRAKAQSITANPALVNGSIGSSSDTDYFKVSIAAGKTLVATLAPKSGADFDLYAYNSAGTRTALSNLAGSATDTVSVRNSGTTAITYYLRVVRYASTGTYTLKLSQ